MGLHSGGGVGGVGYYQRAFCIGDLGGSFMGGLILGWGAGVLVIGILQNSCQNLQNDCVVV